MRSPTHSKIKNLAKLFEAALFAGHKSIGAGYCLQWFYAAAAVCDMLPPSNAFICHRWSASETKPDHHWNRRSWKGYCQNQSQIWQSWWRERSPKWCRGLLSLYSFQYTITIFSFIDYFAAHLPLVFTFHFLYRIFVASFSLSSQCISFYAVLCSLFTTFSLLWNIRNYKEV